MKQGIIIAIGLLLTSIYLKVNAQQPFGIIERIVESYADDIGDEGDITPVMEDLERFLETPLNLNTVNRYELEKLYFLTTFQIESLLAYRKKVGQLFSHYELQAVEGFNSQLVTDIAAFTVLLPPNEVLKTYWKNDLLLRYGQTLERAAGFVPNADGVKAYNGLPGAYLLKYRVEKGDRFKIGFTAENDPGEDLFRGNNPYGFDFYSGYLGFGGNKVLKQVYVGDFQVKTGQGLVQWSGYGKRKTSDGVGVRATGQGLRPNTSVDENNFMRGAAAAIELGSFDLMTYYSNNNVDATVAETDSAGNALRVTSLQNTGYHRTAREMQNKNSLNAQTAGATIKYTVNRFSAGLNGAWQKFNALVDPAWQPYNHHYFRGNENFNLSTDWLWVFNRINLFGEAAISKSGGTAVLAGFESQLVNRVGISMVYRNFSPDFHSIKGAAFAESSGNRNEHGLYVGMSVLPMAKLKVSGYIDSYASHWIRYTSSGPVRGTDFIAQTDYAASRNLSMYLRAKVEVNSEKSSEDAPIKTDDEQQVVRVRYHANWKANNNLSFRFRTEWSGYQKALINNSGWLVYADAVSKPLPKLSATARIAWFNTNSYDSRVYAYENDVPQYFYIPAFYSHGMRYYLYLSYELIPRLMVYAKLSQTRYFDEDFAIGSGNTAIEGNTRTALRIQLRYRF
jgi:hypothetical protein